MHSLVALMLGAMLGATLRYYAGMWATVVLGSTFPYGTLLVNGAGSFVLGLFYGYLALRPELHPAWRMLIAVGFCGSLTTFSTYSFETLALIERGQLLSAALYALGSMALGLLMVWLGVLVGRAVA
ncbi:fluoride efflux transporter CrcB [Candidatus Gracilibacteria bacterium]|nr:fluoride efflux transporter CrcB [Candidatus Gracilibacteria bacterium]